MQQLTYKATAVRWPLADLVAWRIVLGIARTSQVFESVHHAAAPVQERMATVVFGVANEFALRTQRIAHAAIGTNLHRIALHLRHRTGEAYRQLRIRLDLVYEPFSLLSAVRLPEKRSRL